MALAQVRSEPKENLELETWPLFPFARRLGWVAMSNYLMLWTAGFRLCYILDGRVFAQSCDSFEYENHTMERNSVARNDIAEMADSAGHLLSRRADDRQWSGRTHHH